ncbi:MAG: RodZ domain-containing protein [Terriglobales bacterium]
MPSFGEKLKLEREKRKISLDEISSTTKIGTRMLQALEGDKFNQLPGGIFNKGFVRAYARAVGLDEDQAIADYLEASGEGPRPESETREGGIRDAAADEAASRHAAARNTAARQEENRIRLLEATSDESSRPLPWGLFAVVLLIIALALSLWSHRRREQERLAGHPAARAALPSTQNSSENGAPGASNPAADGATPAGATPQTNSPSGPGCVPGATGSGATGSGTTPAAGAAEKTPSYSGSAKPEQTAPQALSTTAGAQSGALTAGEFQVLLHAREESWISVSVDGKFIGSETLEAGADRVYRVRSRIYVKAGNSGAIDFQLDGKKLDIGGHEGEVRAVTIGHAGVISTAAATPQNP